MKIDVNDIVGQKFGKLTVLSFSHKKPHKTGTGFTYYYLCRCECGTEKLYDRGSLRRTHGTTSCGCVCKKPSVIGQKFNRLTALELHHTEPRYRANGNKSGHREFYLCKCDCGQITIVEKTALRTGRTKSCGCYKKEIQKINPTTHSLSRHRLYGIYHKIKSRCYKPKNTVYYFFN